MWYRSFPSSKSDLIPVPKAVTRVLISSLASILSSRAFSTFRILPLIGKIAWNFLSLPCFAEPPAESPSTIYTSQREGSFSEQSANFPGRALISKAFFRRTKSFAFFAASLAMAAPIALDTIALAILGCSSKNFPSCSLTICSTIPLTSVFPNFPLVCPSNCGSGIFMLKTAIKPSLTSSPVRLISLLLSILFWTA